MVSLAYLDGDDLPTDVGGPWRELVTELTEVPKVHGMARGSLAWARRLPGLDGPSAGS